MAETKTNPKVVLVNQSFYPDLAATAQYLTDLGLALKQRGFEVTALAAQRDYFNHKNLHPKHEVYQGIQIQRVWSLGFQRFRKFSRILDAFLMNIALAWKLLWFPRSDHIVVLTTPPLLLWFTRLIALIKRTRVTLWAMDINPEQAIETGWVKKDSVVARLLISLNGWFLRSLSGVVVLDHHMAQKLLQAGVSEKSLHIVPLWADQSELSPVPRSENLFRKQHKLEDRFVVMYSGNQSICHPLDTLLHAALQLREDSSICFVFVGGGARAFEVNQFRLQYNLENIIQLPYQDRAFLPHSLSAADLHVVTMGENYVGLVHPSKIYGILAVQKPVLYIGPEKSPIGDIVNSIDYGFHVNHGDISRAIEVIQDCKSGKVQVQPNSKQLRSFDTAVVTEQLVDVLVK